MEPNKKRLFFGFEVIAPWPEKLPMGKLLDVHNRHITLAFLGTTDWNQLSQALTQFPIPPFKVGLAGKFDHCQFLPKRHSNVVAWHVEWIDDVQMLLAYQKGFTQWLIQKGFSPSQPDRKWLPHVTLCRKPFNARLWNDTFVSLPMIFQNLHLYESLGNSKYQSIWHYPILPPFEELDHIADIAFMIYGESLQQIVTHAQIALAFTFPPLLNYLEQVSELHSLEDIVIHLNSLISQTDKAIGCPFKAVSFHGDLVKRDDNTLQWEMIVDV